MSARSRRDTGWAGLRGLPVRFWHVVLAVVAVALVALPGMASASSRAAATGAGTRATLAAAASTGSPVTAQIWVSPSGSDSGATCARQGSPVAFSALGGSGCASFFRAFQLASSSDRIGVRTGTYTGQTIGRNSKVTSMVTILADGGNVTIGQTPGKYYSLCLGNTSSGNCDGNLVDPPSWVTVDSVNGGGKFVFTSTIRGAFRNRMGANHVTILGGHTLNVSAIGSSYLTLDGIEVGPNCCSTDGIVMGISPTSTNTANFTLKDSYIHDIGRRCSQYPGRSADGVGPATCPGDNPSAHVDGLQMFSGSNPTIVGNRFYRLATQGIFLGGAGTGAGPTDTTCTDPTVGCYAGTITVENNMIGAVYEPGTPVGIGRGITQTDPSFAPGSVVDFDYNSTTGNCSAIHSAVPPRSINYIGNVCNWPAWVATKQQAGVTYTFSHNLMSGQTGSSTDILASSLWAIFDDVTVAGTDLHLQPGVTAIDAGDPAVYPGDDVDGTPRPVGARPDIGADEAGAAAPAKPVNTSAPIISGAALSGQTLTASAGAWSGSPTPTFAYQWQRCNTSGASCTNLTGKTGTSYVLGSGDVGSTVRVAVTGTNSVGSSSSASAATAVVSGSAGKPVNTALPTISGTTQSGQTLTASAGTWSGSPTLTFTYQWQRCNSAGSSCFSLSGRTGSSYALAVADVGTTLRVVVTGKNTLGSSTATSAATAVVSATSGKPVNTGAPAIAGTPQKGQTLSGSQGSWTGSPTSYSYQWQRCDGSGGNCSDISGASGTTYQLGSGDVGSTITLVVTARNGFGSTPASSAAVGPVSTGISTVTVTLYGSAGSDDGDLQMASRWYPPGGGAHANTYGSMMTAGRRWAYGNYAVLDALMRFDTSNIPDDATVTAATLKVFVNSKADADSRNLVADWYNASSWPISSSDYTLDPVGSALPSAQIEGLATGAYNSFTLGNLGSISLTGQTGLRLQVGGGKPSGDNYVQMSTYEDGNGRPQLVVTYTVGG